MSALPLALSSSSPVTEGASASAAILRLLTRRGSLRLGVRLSLLLGGREEGDAGRWSCVWQRLHGEVSVARRVREKNGVKERRNSHER